MKNKDAAFLIHTLNHDYHILFTLNKNLGYIKLPPLNILFTSIIYGWGCKHHIHHIHLRHFVFEKKSWSNFFNVVGSCITKCHGASIFWTTHLSFIWFYWHDTSRYPSSIMGQIIQTKVDQVFMLTKALSKVTKGVLMRLGPPWFHHT